MVSDIVYFMLAGAVLMLVPIFVIAYFQAGFFGAWMKTRAGRGKYVLIKMRSKLRDHFTTGEIVGEFIVTGKKEKSRRYLLQDKNGTSIYRAWGIACVDIDEASGAVCSVNYQAVSGFDAEKFEGLYIRALYRPDLEESKEKLILIAIAACIAIGLVGLFLTWNISQQIAALGAQGIINTVL